jgi:hypothetical protein
MENNFKITVLESGEVSSLLLELIKNSSYPLEVVPTIGSQDGVDILIDCSTDSDNLEQIKSSLSQGRPVILSSKVLMVRHSEELILLAKENKTKIYLNSLFSSKDNNRYSLINISEKNIKLIDIEEALSIESYNDSTASSLYQDILRAHNRWNPKFEADRTTRLDMEKESRNKNIYSVAKKLNVQVEVQPCGIDPKIPESAEVDNVSKNNK